MLPVFMFEFMFDMFPFALPFMLEFMFEFMFPFMLDMFEFIFEPMFEFMFDEPMLELVVVVVVVVVVFEFTVAVLELVVLVLSAGAQPTKKAAMVIRARRAKYRRIEFPPEPQGFSVMERRQTSPGVFRTGRGYALRSVSTVYSHKCVSLQV
jgi:hypothetical protein